MMMMTKIFMFCLVYRLLILSKFQVLIYLNSLANIIFQCTLIRNNGFYSYIEASLMAYFKILFVYLFEKQKTFRNLPVSSLLCSVHNNWDLAKRKYRTPIRSPIEVAGVQAFDSSAQSPRVCISRKLECKWRQDSVPCAPVKGCSCAKSMLTTVPSIQSLPTFH